MPISSAVLSMLQPDRTRERRGGGVETRPSRTGDDCRRLAPALTSAAACAAPQAFVKRSDDIPLGILFMVAATVLFAISSAIAKWQVAVYPVGEVMFARS